jgi:hypothetical protein
MRQRLTGQNMFYFVCACGYKKYRLYMSGCEKKMIFYNHEWRKMPVIVERSLFSLQFWKISQKIFLVLWYELCPNNYLLVIGFRIFICT